MAALAPSTPHVLHLSLVVGGSLRDDAGERLGRVDDLIVRLEGEEYPPVSGAVATVAGRQVFVPWASIALFVTVAITWFVPDRRVTRVLAN